RRVRRRTCPRPPAWPTPSRPGGRPSSSRSPSASPTPEPKASTGSSSRSNASPAGSATWTTIEGASWHTSQSPDRDYRQHDEAAPLKYQDPVCQRVAQDPKLAQPCGGLGLDVVPQRRPETLQ